MNIHFYIPIQEDLIQEAKTYALYDAHEKYGDTKNNRKNNQVDLNKEKEIVQSIKSNTDLWWKLGIGFCEDNPAFSKDLKVLEFENQYYLETTYKKIYINNRFKTNDIFHSKKSLKNYLKSSFNELSNDDIKMISDFWKNNPNGIATIN